MNLYGSEKATKLLKNRLWFEVKFDSNKKKSEVKKIFGKKIFILSQNPKFFRFFSIFAEIFIEPRINND